VIDVKILVNPGNSNPILVFWQGYGKDLETKLLPGEAVIIHEVDENTMFLKGEPGDAVIVEVDGAPASLKVEKIQ